MPTDLRPTLPEATKQATKHGHVWLIDGRKYNFLRATNKYGEECGCVRISGNERYAKYRAGHNFLVGVFLAVDDTAI